MRKIYDIGDKTFEGPVSAAEYILQNAKGEFEERLGADIAEEDYDRLFQEWQASEKDALVQILNDMQDDGYIMYFGFDIDCTYEN